MCKRCCGHPRFDRFGEGLRQAWPRRRRCDFFKHRYARRSKPKTVNGRYCVSKGLPWRGRLHWPCLITAAKYSGAQPATLPKQTVQMVGKCRRFLDRADHDQRCALMQNTIDLFSVPWIGHRCLLRINYDPVKLLITKGQLIQVTQQVGWGSCLIRSFNAHPQDTPKRALV